jgi:acetyl-CoA carboxylase biotin carboxyl carrier protein
MAKTPAAKMASKKTAAAALKPPTGSAAKPAVASREKSAFGIDTDLVRAIAQLLNETNVGEIQVAKGDLKVRVSRHGGMPYGAQPMMAPMHHAAPAPIVAAEKLATVVVADAAAHPGAVKSPMVGTAYRKPSPDAKNFVEVGSIVKAGDKVLLIEAMKTFNDISAPANGTITAIMVEDGQPVEFGQALFVIE